MKKVAATLLLFLYLSSAQQEPQCGSIGNSSETAATPSKAAKSVFYLDTANPASCSGNIISWRVCYYEPDNVSSSVESYWATYAVYRMAMTRIGQYIRVSEIFKALITGGNFTGNINSSIDGEITQGGFNCYTDDHSIDIPFTVQNGDVIGACVFDPDGDDTQPLDIVGEASGESLLQKVTSDCTMEVIPSEVRIGSGPVNERLSTIESRRLHIYANIDGEADPTTTQAASITTMVVTTISGTFMRTSTEQNVKPGSQTSSVVAIAAGSVGGGLVVLLLLVIIIIFSTIIVHLTLRKKKVYSLSVNKPSDENITTVTENSTVHKPAVHIATVNAGFEITQCHESTEQQSPTENCRDSKLDMEQNVAYEPSNGSTAQISLTSNVAYCRKTLNMEHNVAYGSSTDAQISLTSNTAYYKSGKPFEEHDYEKLDQTEYDYVV